MAAQVRCHYEVLNVSRDADAATIKKSHRRLALRHHPDKNIGKSVEEFEKSAQEFKLLQAAYECLSDPVERKWYDEHREMVLRGGSPDGADGGDGSSFVFDVMPYHSAACYDGYDDEDLGSFYAVYHEVFEQIFRGERDGFISEGNIDVNEMSNAHLSEVHFGNSASDWEDTLAFYSAWEGFTSCLCFAWEDVYQLCDIREAPNRRVRRLMDEENKKKRKAAKKERMEEVCALLRFVKKRDPRVRTRREHVLQEQSTKETEKKKQAAQRKKDLAAAKEEWRIEAERTMTEQAAADLNAGRTRLADLYDDDYDYGGKRGRKKKGKGKGKGKRSKDIEIQNMEECADKHSVSDDKNDLDQDITIINEDDVDPGHDKNKVETVALSSRCDNSPNEDDVCIALNALNAAIRSESSEEEEPNSWRCECCRKDFKSLKQFENHERSKKHKESLKKYNQKRREHTKDRALEDMMEEISHDKCLRSMEHRLGGVPFT